MGLAVFADDALKFVGRVGGKVVQTVGDTGLAQSLKTGFKEVSTDTLETVNNKVTSQVVDGVQTIVTESTTAPAKELLEATAKQTDEIQQGFWKKRVVDPFNNLWQSIKKFFAGEVADDVAKEVTESMADAAPPIVKVDLRPDTDVALAINQAITPRSGPAFAPFKHSLSRIDAPEVAEQYLGLINKQIESASGTKLNRLQDLKSVLRQKHDPSFIIEQLNTIKPGQGLTLAQAREAVQSLHPTHLDTLVEQVKSADLPDTVKKPLEQVLEGISGDINSKTLVFKATSPEDLAVEFLANNPTIKQLRQTAKQLNGQEQLAAFTKAIEETEIQGVDKTQLLEFLGKSGVNKQGVVQIHRTMPGKIAHAANPVTWERKAAEGIRQHIGAHVNNPMAAAHAGVKQTAAGVLISHNPTAQKVVGQLADNASEVITPNTAGEFIGPFADAGDAIRRVGPLSPGQGYETVNTAAHNRGIFNVIGDKAAADIAVTQDAIGNAYTAAHEAITGAIGSIHPVAMADTAVQSLNSGIDVVNGMNVPTLDPGTAHTAVENLVNFVTNLVGSGAVG